MITEKMYCERWKCMSSDEAPTQLMKSLDSLGCYLASTECIKTEDTFDTFYFRGQVRFPCRPPLWFGMHLYMYGLELLLEKLGMRQSSAQ